MKFKLSDFDFNLPPELIAQYPSTLRDHSNLLVVKPNENLLKTEFYNIADYLQPNDLLVFNDSKVIKAKLLLEKQGQKIEFYLNKKLGEHTQTISNFEEQKIYAWLGFAKPARKLKEGDEFSFGNHKVIVTKKLAMGETELQFKLDKISVFEFLEQYGLMPLPPYIKRTELDGLDNQRYQTVFSKTLGSVAAPTAGLHFTKQLISKIKEKKVQIAYVTLHVGSGTFLPVKTEDISKHRMHTEYCYIDKQTADIINNTKKFGGRIIAVGTTTVRTLESAALKNGKVQAGEFETNIFIKPSFNFQIVDMLVTNFHLPKSTLFILVCAFAGYLGIQKAYEYAIKEKMRFFSYGDSMLLYSNF